ncbi:hypothetical protein OJAV_G00157790 [Oryzias javanicus]|uniref:Ig-like domain-containing protein n=1 Tax=Oryzias javanicus TaxID=123683 RepID=A0A437CIN2_ORYJA|nr:hypothetical protein OJAV_G00157790 [Oryzias javanicus]
MCELSTKQPSRICVCLNMLQLNVIPLSLVFTLASCVQDQGWKLNVSRNITVEKGSNVTIHCLFSYPEKHHTPDVKVYWKTPGTSACSKTDNDREAFVFHPNETCVLPRFKGRTRLIGSEKSGNCSLQILNIEKGEFMYVRIVAKGTYISQPTHEPDAFIITTASPSTESVSETWTLNTYMAAIIPTALAAVVIITGVAICMKRRRSSRSLTREESSYYVNFRRALTNSHKRETVSKTSDIKVSDKKNVDDPIYINVQAPADEVNQSSDRKENLYGNVDYSN